LEELPKEGIVTHTPIIYVYLNKEQRYKYAVLFIGRSQIEIPPQDLTTVGILMAFVKAHHVLQVGYTPANEVLALILEMTLCGLNKNETDCTPNPALAKFIMSLGYNEFST